MNVETCDGFSGHSDRRQLLGYVNNMSPRPERIIFGHGEESKCVDISSTIHKRMNINTLVPMNLETTFANLTIFSKETFLSPLSIPPI